MSMGYISNVVVEIEDSELEKLELETYKEFTKTLKSENFDINDFALYRQYRTMSSSYDEVKITKVNNAYNLFINEFEEVYNMSLTIDHHDSEVRGGSYDDIDGVFYALDFNQVYRLSEKAQTLDLDASFKMSQFVYDC